MKTKIKLNQMKTDELLEEIKQNNLKIDKVEKITDGKCEDCGIPHIYLRFEGDLDWDFIYEEYGEEEGDKLIENYNSSCGECRDKEYEMCIKRGRLEENIYDIVELLKMRVGYLMRLENWIDDGYIKDEKLKYNHIWSKCKKWKIHI